MQGEPGACTQVRLRSYEPWSKLPKHGGYTGIIHRILIEVLRSFYIRSVDPGSYSVHNRSINMQGQDRQHSLGIVQCGFVFGKKFERWVPHVWACGHVDSWTSKRAQNNGPISQNGDYRQYRVHYIGHFGGPGSSNRRR